MRRLCIRFQFYAPFSPSLSSPQFTRIIFYCIHPQPTVRTLEPQKDEMNLSPAEPLLLKEKNSGGHFLARRSEYMDATG
jgi:hypothetical protein